MTQPRTLFPDRATTKKTSLNIFMYYKRPDGWIAPGWAHPNAYASKLESGFTPLPQYGTYTPGQSSTDIRGESFDAHAEMWRVIFQKNGAEAFPVDQIVAYNWHLTPPYEGVTFPQMEGVDVPQLDCPECALPPCHDVADLGTHLRIRHGYTRTDLTVYGNEIGIKFDRKRTRIQVREMPKPPVKDLKPATTERGEACGLDGCPWSPTKGKNYEKAMKGHRRMKHQSGTVPAQEGATDGITEIQQA